MKNRFAVVFGAVIAFILLTLYSGSLCFMIFKVLRSDHTTVIPFADGLVYVVTTIGGLVSALVVAKLAITKPGDNPTFIRETDKIDVTLGFWVNLLAGCYLAIWLVVGLASLIVGVMLYPAVSQTLRDIGTTWLGLAVAAGYAYFGVTPKS